ASENEFYSIIEAPDGSIYAAGDITPKLGLGSETWLVKLSADGCIDDYLNCNENLQIYTAISPPPQQWGANSPFLRALGGVTLNPAHQTATLTLNPNYTHLIKQGEALEIFNTQGRLVKTVPLSSGGETTTFSTANLISGIYYCRLQNHPEIEGVKMVVW
nr:T9SS type A sorting domain-containing protein [Chitinophagales bacterium]